MHGSSADPRARPPGGLSPLSVGSSSGESPPSRPRSFGRQLSFERVRRPRSSKEDITSLSEEAPPTRSRSFPRTLGRQLSFERGKANSPLARSNSLPRSRSPRLGVRSPSMARSRPSPPDRRVRETMARVKAAKEAASAAAATEAVVAAAESAPQSYQVGAYDLMGV